MAGFSPNWDNLNFVRNQYSSEVLLRTRMPTIARMVTAKKYEEKSIMPYYKSDISIIKISKRVICMANKFLICMTTLLQLG